MEVPQGMGVPHIGMLTTEDMLTGMAMAIMVTTATTATTTNTVKVSFSSAPQLVLADLLLSFCECQERGIGGLLGRLGGKHAHAHHGHYEEHHHKKRGFGGLALAGACRRFP